MSILKETSTLRKHRPDKEKRPVFGCRAAKPGQDLGEVWDPIGKPIIFPRLHYWSYTISVEKYLAENGK